MTFEGLEQCICTASMAVFLYFNNCAYKLNVSPLPSYSPKRESLLTAFWVSFQKYSTNHTSKCISVPPAFYVQMVNTILNFAFLLHILLYQHLEMLVHFLTIYLHIYP